MNEIKKQALIKEIKMLECKVEETRIQHPNDVLYYIKVALDTVSYYIDTLFLDAYYHELNERFMFRLRSAPKVKPSFIEDIIPICLEYLKSISEHKPKLSKVPFKLYVYKMENYDLREQMIDDIYDESKDKDVYYDEFAKLNKDYILLNSKFDINNLIQKNECACADDKITFEDISLKIFLFPITDIHEKKPIVRKISVVYKNEFKQLDIHEATKFIDKCISDYNNSIEE